MFVAISDVSKAISDILKEPTINNKELLIKDISTSLTKALAKVNIAEKINTTKDNNNTMEDNNTTKDNDTAKHNNNATKNCDNTTKDNNNNTAKETIVKKIKTPKKIKDLHCTVSPLNNKINYKYFNYSIVFSM